MDEIALVVNRIEADGRLRVVPAGGLKPYKIGERAMEIIGDQGSVPGILSTGSGHSSKPNQALDWHECWVFTGLTETQLRDAGVHEGAALVPARQGRGPILMGEPENPCLAAWTLDDRMGIAALLQTLGEIRERQLTPAFPLIIAFTVHEEGGCHGAKVLAHREQPQAFIAVDGCPVMEEAPLKLDGRPAVWLKDSKACYHQRLTNDLVKAAADAGVELQRAVYQNVSSDASAVYNSGGAPAVALIGHVRENSHGFEVTRLSVLENLRKTLVQFIQSNR